MIVLYEGINIQGNGGVNPSATFTSDPFPLLDAISCTVTEERNGQFSLVLQYPIGAQYWEKIIPDAVIMASPRPNADVEPFRIYEIEQVIEGVVTARANHLVYDLDGLSIGTPAKTFAGKQGITAVLNQLNTSGQFVMRCFELANDGITDTTTELDFGNTKYCSIWKCIGIVAAAFKAEMKYTWNTSTNRCTITFCAARGTAKPTVISYGVNLVQLDRKLDYSNLYSRVVATWFNPDPNALPRYWQGFANTGYTGRVRSLWIDVTEMFPTIPTTEELNDVAQAYIDSHDFNPLSDLSVEFIPLENTTENKYVPLPKLTDNAPYVKRKSGGALDLGIRNREDDKLIGGTIAWNQLCNGSSTSVPNGHKYVAYIGGSWSVGVSNGTALSTDASTDKVFDITHMFGSTIADYAYTLESGTRGAGIAWLKSYGFFSKDYYPYHTATLESVNASAHVMRDSSNNVIGNYALDADLQLRGILKLDASNKLYYDGDEYASDGTVKRKYGIVDLGTLSWSYNSTVTRFGTGSLASVIARPSGNNVIGNIKCAKYVTDITDHGTDANYDKIIMVAASGNVFIRDSAYDSAVALKASLSGVYLIYELATPTTESADPYTNPQSVYPTGTERYVDASYAAGTRDFEMPVGHETSYFVIYADTSLYLCDTATVDASLIGVSATAKCVKVVYNEITGKYDSVTVGTIQTDIVDTILKLGE